jgi:hypothetical protein
VTTKEQETQEIPSWQPLAAQDFEREQHPHLRMSSAGKCPRAQAYALMGVEESDPPDRHAQNRMNLGHAAEVLIVMDLHRNGWETDNTVLSDSGQLELEVQVPGTDVTLRGHPDGICRHPEFTQNLWVTLECKSMSERKGLEVEEQGIAKVYPAYMTQIGLYGRRLHEMGLVSHPERGVFAMMDRDGRPLSPERVPWTAEDVDRDYQTLREIIETAGNEELPERPHPHGSKICGGCNYHTECWGTYRAWQEKGRPILTNDTRGIDAAETWMNAKPQVDEARVVLQELCDEAGQTDIIAGPVQAGYFEPRDNKVYNPDLLEAKVPIEILKQCFQDPRKRRPAFWIRLRRN